VSYCKQRNYIQEKPSFLLSYSCLTFSNPRYHRKMVLERC